jgi:cytochrome c-type biogenesis protein CcmH
VRAKSSAGAHAIAMVAAVCATLAVALLAPVSAASRPTEADVAQSLTCQCGCGLTIANCNHPNCEFAVPVRHKIDAMIARGMSKVQIIAFFRHKYGEKILSSPTTQGFNLLAWTMPFIALALGGAFIVVTAARWRSAGASPAEPSPTKAPSPRDAPADAERRRRLEDEIKENL